MNKSLLKSRIEFNRINGQAWENDCLIHHVFQEIKRGIERI
jgi:hypothetical protein